MAETTTKTKAAMLLELESIKGLLLEEDDIPILQEVEESEGFSSESFDIDTSHTDDLDLDAEDFKAAELYEEDFDENALDEELIHPQSSTFSSSTFEPQPLIKNSHHSVENETAKPVTRLIVEEQQDFFDSPSPANSLKSETQQIASEKDLLNTIDELEKHTAEVAASKFSQDLHKTSARPSLAKATGENPFLPAHIRSRLHGNNPPPLFAQETAKKIASSSIPSRLLGNTFGATQINKTTGLRNAIIDSLVEKFMPDIEKELRDKLQTLTKEQLEELNRFNPL